MKRSRYPRSHCIAYAIITNMKTAVRLISEVDKDAISQVNVLEHEIFGKGGLNEWHLPFIIRFGRLFVLELDGRVAGAAELVKAWNNPLDAYLIGISVNKLFRGLGYGRYFLKSVIMTLKDDGVRRLLLTADEANHAALNLYRGVGFKIVGNLPNEYGPETDRLLMQLDLSEADLRS